jgi:hypothetical protein
LTSVPNQQPHRDRLHADVLYWLDPALLRLRDAAESLAVADSEATRDAAIDKLNNACDGWRFQGKNFGQLFGLAIVARQREARKAKAKTLVAAEYLGEGRIRMDGQTKLLTAKAQIDFVERVLEGNGVASTSELTKAGVSNPSQTATELETLANGWLSAIVDRPAKKGQGYKLRLSDSRNLAKH